MKKIMFFLAMLSALVSACQTRSNEPIRTEESIFAVQDHEKWEYTKEVLIYCDVAKEDYSKLSCITPEEVYTYCEIYNADFRNISCITQPENTDFVEFLNKKGEEGWELVDITTFTDAGYILVYKRPK